MRSIAVLFCLIAASISISGCDIVGSNSESAGDPPEEAPPPQLLASHASNVAQFGLALDADGDRVIVGSLSSRAYVYEWNGTAWVEQAELVLNDPKGKIIINSVAISRDRAVVGQSGVAHVFAWNGSEWRQEATLTDSTDGYYSVAIDGDRIVLGNPGYTDEAREAQGFPGPGIAHVYEWDDDSWVGTATLSPSDGRKFDRFGEEVALDGDHLVVATTNAPDGAYYVNRLHFFEWRGQEWVESGISEQTGMSLSNSLALDDDRLVVGQPNDMEFDFVAQVLFFEWDGQTWREQARFDNPPEVPDSTSSLYFDDFGTSVALEGDVAVVGAPGYPDGRDAGTVHIYEFEGGQWQWTRQLTPEDLPADLRREEAGLGKAVALEGDVLIMSAPGDAFYLPGETGPGSGWVYTYPLLP